MSYSSSGRSQTETGVAVLDETSLTVIGRQETGRLSLYGANFGPPSACHVEIGKIPDVSIYPPDYNPNGISEMGSKHRCLID